MPRPQPRLRTLSLESLETRRLLTFNPTAAEQEFFQLTNRFRDDPAGEYSRLISRASPIQARDPILQNDLDAAGVNASTLRAELQAMSPAPPLAWNEAIYEFTKAHNAEMLSRNPPQQFHSNTLERRQALLDAGVDLRFRTGEKINSENVFGYAKSALHLFAAYVIDWGPGPGGMQPNRPHRVALANADFEQVGHAIRGYSGSANFGPLVNTQVLANIESPPTMVVGAVFEDKNDSGWYEAGEGLGTVQIVFDGPSGRFTTTTMAAGGYQVELPAGTYKLTATGGGMRYPVVVQSVTVDDVNVWQDVIYDPDFIPADAMESNNTLATATALQPGSHQLQNLSIHVPSDVDYFRFVPPGTGAGSITLQFTSAEGNLDLRLRDGSGNIIGSSAGNGNTETITRPLIRDQAYFVEVFSRGSASNGSYTLSVTPPAAAPPIAVADQTNANNAARQVTLNIVDNDLDPDGPVSALVPELMPGTHTAFSLVDKQLRYTAPSGYSGVHRAMYRVVDDQGLRSEPAAASVFVVDFNEPFPWQNPVVPTDANDDGVTAPSDALLVINELNRGGSRRLPTGPSGAQALFGFLDINQDGFISPIDALVVINAINANSGGEGEQAPHIDLATVSRAKATLPPDTEAHDEAISAMVAAGYGAYWPASHPLNVKAQLNDEERLQAMGRLHGPETDFFDLA